MKNLAKFRNIILAAVVMMTAFVCHSPVAAAEKPAYVQPPVRLNAALVVPDG
ncbi:unnamed protein product, partial [marine sediment metagenome]